jgi:integrase
MKLTNTTIKAMDYKKANNKADLRFDDETRGFGIRVYPSGCKSFFVSYRNKSGTKKRHTIGDFGLFTTTDARRLAQDMLADVRRGTDPQMDRQEKRQEDTFAELAERYLEYVKDRKRSYRDDAQRLRDHVLPTLGPKKLSEITLRQLQAIHTSVKKRLSPSTANRVAALIKHVFTMAGKWSLITDNPSKHLTMFREPPPRNIFLVPEDCLKLIEACNKDENVFAGALFKLAMFTGRRVGELLNSKWNDLNLDNAILTLPNTKAGERQFVYLNEMALVVLRTLPHLDGTPFIIAGQKRGG